MDNLDELIAGLESSAKAFRENTVYTQDNRADVSALAEKFGGGGHRNASGFKVPKT